MLGFILSKMNLMILVVALFAIIAYFTFSTADVMKQNQAQLMVNRYTKDVSAMLTSATYCDRVGLFLPPYISVIGRTSYYTMRIAMIDDDENALTGNFLVFAVYSKEDPDYVLAAGSVRNFAQIHVFDFNTAEEVDAEQGITLDPQAFPPENGFVIIKKVIGGQQHVFIIPCNVPTFAVGEVCGAQVFKAFTYLSEQDAFEALQADDEEELERKINEFIC